MNSKDFIKMIREKVSQSHKKALSVHSYKQRQSRPRVTKNILQPQSQEALDNMYGYYDEPKGKETTNCVVNDCTHDWGGE